MAKASRPIIIAILAILQFIVGILALIAGIMVIVGGVAAADLPSQIADLGVTATGAVLIIIGIIYLVIAGGFWNGWSIMWYIGVVVNVIMLIFNIFTLVTGDPISAIVGILIEALILYYLFRPGVKAFFGI